MRVVLDTNVVISATLIRGGNEDRILRAWQRGVFEVVLSPQMLDEMRRALFYERLRKFRWMKDAEIVVLLQLLAQECVLVPGKLRIAASRDPDDDKFLVAAVEGHAKYLVTGDQDLRSLKRFRGVRIITPATFLKIIGGRQKV